MSPSVPEKKSMGICFERVSGIFLRFVGIRAHAGKNHRGKACRQIKNDHAGKDGHKNKGIVVDPFQGNK